MGSDEVLLLALESGSMVSIAGRDNIISKEIPKATGVSGAEEIEEETESDFLGGDLETQPAAAKDTDHQLGGKKKRLQKASGPDDNDDDDDVTFDDNQIENSKSPFVADEAEENDGSNDDSAEKARDTTSGTLNDGVEVDDIHEDDENTQQFDTGDDFEDNYDVVNHEGGGVARIPLPQAPFAPSSTPLARRRILCWNQHGVISSREREELDGSSSRTIDISFVDSASRRPVSFRDPYNFIVGTIGEEGGLFASDLIEDNDDDEPDIDLGILNGMSESTREVVRRSERRKNGLRSDRATGSCIYFHRFNTFGSKHDKDWTLTLPEDERVLGCSSGSGWNAVVTR